MGSSMDSRCYPKMEKEKVEETKMSFVIRVRMGPDKYAYYALSDSPEDVRLGTTVRLVANAEDAYQFPTREAALNVIGHHYRIPFELSEVMQTTRG